MKIAILGFAGQGKSSYEYWNTPDNEITICDSDANTEVPKGAKRQLGEDALKNLDQFDLLIRTPILHPNKIVEANPNATDILDKVWSNTNEFLKACPTRNIIGVTGTKGKGTTSTLIAKILEAAGYKVHLGGNIGTPPLKMLKDNIQPDDWVVLELANFQLIDLKSSPNIAVCLMVVPEHLDWHTDMDEYIKAKKQLFKWQKSDDVAIYYSENSISKDIATESSGNKVPYYQPPGAYIKDDSILINNQVICRTDELKLLGKHNWQNVCAAVTATWQVTQDTGAIRTAVINFSGLPFRIEFRAEKNGVKYYNDSFATGQGATIAAIEAIKEPKVMIIGGHDRNLELTELANALIKNAGSIRKVLLIGASAQRTASVLDDNGFTNYVMSTANTMLEIVKDAQALAQPGDSVVLSPAFASFDMFKNFEDRGIKFNQAVEQL